MLSQIIKFFKRLIHRRQFIEPPIYYALLSLQSALLNAVIPQLRAVSTEIDEENKNLLLFFYYTGELTEQELEILSIAATETNQPDYLNSEYFIRLDFPEILPKKGIFAFLRHESILPAVCITSHSSLFQTSSPLVVLRLDMQQALLGKINPSLRCVYVDINADQKQISVDFIYDGEIYDEDRKLTALSINEGTISFPDYTINSSIQRIDFPNPISLKGKKPVYARTEVLYSGSD